MLAIEAVAGAEILQRWIDLPLWLMALALMVLLTGINLTSVKSFGEFEFWFAGIKVVAIVAFIVIAVGFLFGIGGGDSPGLSNLTSHDGFAPAGGVTILSGVVIVIFAFVGAEIVTIAAAESDEPEQNVTQGDQPGRAARAHLLRRRDLPDRLRRAVERRQAGQVDRSSPRSRRSASRARRT